MEKVFGSSSYIMTKNISYLNMAIICFLESFTGSHELRRNDMVPARFPCTYAAPASLLNFIMALFLCHKTWEVRITQPIDIS